MKSIILIILCFLVTSCISLELKTKYGSAGVEIGGERSGIFYRTDAELLKEDLKELWENRNESDPE